MLSITILLGSLAIFILSLITNPFAIKASSAWLIKPIRLLISRFSVSSVAACIGLSAVKTVASLLVVGRLLNALLYGSRNRLSFVMTNPLRPVSASVISVFNDSSLLITPYVWLTESVSWMDLRIV